MKKDSNKKTSLTKSSIINIITEQFNPDKFDFFDIIYREGNNNEHFELQQGLVYISFYGCAECYDKLDQWTIDDITITELEVWDDDILTKGIITAAEIEILLNQLNYNL